MPSLSPDPERVEDIFHRALVIPAADRAAMLDELCGGDAPLRLYVERLLRTAEAPGAADLFDSGAMHLEAGASVAPDNPDLGRYRLLEKIGAGGMGVVYRAVRADDEYAQEVAIKLAPWAAGDERVASRLRRERQILAGLQHPNIARLLDGGTTPDGTPYLVMELVRGLPLDVWVAERKPSERELVAIFRRICDAVSCAHQNLVVHRDLKPSNILVTETEGRPEPRVLDFGVARLLEDEDNTTRTRALTPEYASPEQITGAPVTTASDVYSLGALLYELLFGQRPYRVTGSAYELADVICKEEPPLPAGGDADLANIALMALRKEPQRRYSSVEEFSRDLGRWLEGYAVLARPNTPGYRARKFVARNRVAVAAGLLLAVAITSGVVATLYEARLANRRFEDVRKLSDAYLFEFHDAIRDVPGTLAARRLVAKRGLQYLDAMVRERTSDRVLKREVAAGYVRIGDVEGRVAFANTGDSAGAIASYKKGAQLAEELLASDATDGAAAITAARGWARAAAILTSQGDLTPAVGLAQRAVRLLEPLASRSVAVREELPELYAALADVEGNPSFPTPGHTDRALELYRKALAGQQEVARTHPDEWEKQLLVGSRHCQVAQLEQALNQGEAAVSNFRKCAAIADEYLRRLPLNVEAKRAVAVTHNNLGLALTQMLGQPAEALEHQTLAVRTFREIADSDLSNSQARLDLADGLFAIGNTARKSGDLRRALQEFDESISVYLGAMKASPGSRQPGGLRTAYQLRADAQIDIGDLTGALESVRQQLAIDDNLLKRDAANAGAQRNQAIAWAQAGRVHTVLAGRKGADSGAEWREALRWYEKARGVYLAQQQQGTFLPVYQRALDAVNKQLDTCRARITALTK